jgi:hypothetical protein
MVAGALVTTLFEWRDCRGLDRTLVGSLILAATGTAAWIAALRTL